MPIVAGIRERADSTSSTDMAPSRLVRQVSIESPTQKLKKCIFNFGDTPMPEVPPDGARIRVRNAGVCYRLRSASSNASTRSLEAATSGSPLHQCVRDTSLFPGYEVAGVIDAIGDNVVGGHFAVGDRIIVYPYEGHPPGYAEFISVPDVCHLVGIPSSMDMGVAAMLPSGGLWAISAVHTAQTHVEEVLKEKEEEDVCRILVVGTGGLALWALRIARHFWPRDAEKTKVVVASLRDEGISIASKELNVSVVQWSEDLYETQLVERTVDACGGRVDIVIDFSATSRSIRRALKCLAKNGIVLMSSERSEGLVGRLSCEAAVNSQQLIPVELGTIDHLKDLVNLVVTGQIEPPPYHIFPADQANEALSKIGRGLIQGRAILEFPEEDEDEQS